MTRKRDAEAELARTLVMLDAPLSTFERQYPYVPGRRFRADFAWPEHRLLVEIQGGVFTGGAHGSVTGIKADIERGNLATLHGWRVLRFLPEQVTRQSQIGDTLETIETVLRRGERSGPALDDSRVDYRSVTPPSSAPYKDGAE